MLKIRWMTAASAIVAFTAGATAWAQTQTQQGVDSQLRERPVRVQGYSVEVKPLPTAASVSSNAGGIGLGFELYGEDNIALYVQGAFVDGSVNQDLLRSMQRQTSDPLPEKLSGYTAGLGARYYRAPLDNSWYAGAGLGYGESTTTWSDAENTIDGRTSAIIPSVDAGYRWLFGENKNGLVRVGAGVGANWIQRNVARTEVAGDAAQESRQRVEDLQAAPVLANLDLGIGMKF